LNPVAATEVALQKPRAGEPVQASGDNHEMIR